jgi:hypothetical protein
MGGLSRARDDAMRWMHVKWVVSLLLLLDYSETALRIVCVLTFHSMQVHL